MQTYTNKPIKRINIYICIYPSRFRFPNTRKTERARLRSCAKRVSDVLNACDFLNCHAVSWRDRRRRENKAREINQCMYQCISLGTERKY